MQSIARRTSLSETTFVLPATDPAADYRVTVVHDAAGPWICGQSVTIIDGTLAC